MTLISRFTPTNYITAGGIVLSVLIGINLFKASFVTVNPGERGVLIKLGKVQTTILDEGIHPILPFITSIKKLNVRIQKTDIETPAGTKDLQSVQTKLALNWYIDPTKVNKIYQQIGDEQQITTQIIIPAITEVLKAATPRKNSRGNYHTTRRIKSCD